MEADHGVIPRVCFVNLDGAQEADAAGNVGELLVVGSQDIAGGVSAYEDEGGEAP